MGVAIPCKTEEEHKKEGNFFHQIEPQVLICRCDANARIGESQKCPNFLSGELNREKGWELLTFLNPSS